MKPLPAIILGIAALFLGRTALCADLRTVESQSGQFLVRGLPASQPPTSRSAVTNVSFVRLDPSVLTISCERIKQALLDVLGMRDEWRGRIFIALHPVQEDREPIVVRSSGFSDGWLYRIQMPEQVDRTRFISVIVEVLLLEIGNRRAHGKPVELPPWLAEGLAVHLDTTTGATLTLEPQTGISQRESRSDPLRTSRQVLRSRPPLTLNELNWPTAEQFTDANVEVYRSCAHLFVRGLLRLKNGRESLQEMLLILPKSLNWQTAFLGSFRDHFPKLADVDKWWTLEVVQVTGRDFRSVWPPEETLRQLEQILTTAVHVRMKTNDLPAPINARLQSVISEWSLDRQWPVLLQKIYQLQALQLRADPKWVGLIGDYMLALDQYLQLRARPARVASDWSQIPLKPKIAIQQAVRRLDALDLKRQRQRQSIGGIGAAVDSALAESFRHHSLTSAPPVSRP